MSDTDQILGVFQQAVHYFNTQQDKKIFPLLAENARIYSVKGQVEGQNATAVCDYLRVNQFQNQKPIFTPPSHPPVSITGATATITGAALWTDRGDLNAQIKFVFAFKKIGGSWKLIQLWGSAVLNDEAPEPPQ